MSSEVGVCPFCLSQKELRLSHIYPRWIFRDLKRVGNENRLLEVTFNPETGERTTKPAQDGVKEKMLCTDCEQLIGNWENRTRQLMVQYRYEHWVQSNSIQRIHAINPVDASNVLYRCLTSFIWKCHYAKHPAFSGVKLGPYEQRMKEAVLSGKTHTGIKLYVGDFASTKTDCYFSIPLRTFRPREYNHIMYFGFANLFVWAEIGTKRSLAREIGFEESLLKPNAESLILNNLDPWRNKEMSAALLQDMLPIPKK